MTREEYMALVDKRIEEMELPEDEKTLKTSDFLRLERGQMACYQAPTEEQIQGLIEMQREKYAKWSIIHRHFGGNESKYRVAYRIIKERSVNGQAA